MRESVSKRRQLSSQSNTRMSQIYINYKINNQILKKNGHRRALLSDQMKDFLFGRRGLHSQICKDMKRQLMDKYPEIKEISNSTITRHHFRKLWKLFSAYEVLSVKCLRHEVIDS